MRSLDQFAAQKICALDADDLLRRLETTDRIGGIDVERDGQRLLSFCCNDYLNLSQHPKVKHAAAEAVERFGTGAGASRLVTGNHSLFRLLEERLADFKGSDDAVVFGSGYLTNLGVIPTLAKPGDLLLVDELAHACIHGGAQLSGADRQLFRHNDVEHLRSLLADKRGAAERALIVTDGVFSMDGDLAPVAALAALAEEYDAWLMTDDAHGVGVIGGGKGSTAACGGPEVPLQMGTLSKAIGSYGGYLCASQPVVDLIRTRARPFIYSTGLPPASVAASLAALDVIESEPERVERPRALARRFTNALSLVEAESCIVPIVLGDARRTLLASQALLGHGFLVTAIRPPTVPRGTARLRITFTAAHTEAQVDALASAIRAEIF